MAKNSMVEQSQQQYRCVNVDRMTSQGVSSQLLLNWINYTLQTSLNSIEELCTGVVYAQLLDLLFPGTIPLKEVKFRAKDEHEYKHNLTIVEQALRRVGCFTQIPLDHLVKGQFQDNYEFLQWFKMFFDANHNSGHDNLDAQTNTPLAGLDCDNNTNPLNHIDEDDKHLVVACLNNKGRIRHIHQNDEDADDVETYDPNITYVDRSWSRKILELVGNKARLMESFSWLSTVGGGYSALGERDSKFSIRAGALSLGQQLQLAELLGDERLKVMCHLFAALAALQLDNKYFCINYIHRVILPLINALPNRDPILTNILRHICFRINATGAFSNNAIEDRNRKSPLNLHKNSENR